MRPIYYLGIFIPAAIALEVAHAGPVVIFGAAALAVIPCAAVMGCLLYTSDAADEL